MPSRLLTTLAAHTTRLRTRLGPVAWGAAVVFIIQRGGDIGNLVCKLFLGRVLPPLDFGAVEPIGATVAILSLPAVIIYGAAVKSISRLRSQDRYAQCNALIHDLQIVAFIGSTLSIVVVFSLRHFILSRLHLESSFFIWMIAFMFAMAWWGPLNLSIIRAEHSYRLLFFSRSIGPVLIITLTLVLVGSLGLGLKGAVAARVLSGLTMLIVVVTLISRRHRGPRESYRQERTLLLKMLLPMSIVAVTSALSVNFDRLFVRNFLVHDSAGLSAIFMLGQLPRLAIAPLTFVLFPIAAAEHASGRELTLMLRRALSVAVLITAACCLAFAIVATPLLRFWRPEFAPYGRYVWLYALMAGLHALNAVIAQVELARHEYRFLWFYAIPIVLACGGIYLVEDYTSIDVTLPALICTLIAAHALTTLCTLAYLRLRPPRRVAPSTP